ncbi:hypothetical protein SAMN05192559_11430 [Halobacillus karajensis]|uniref:Uncharacterized protein n=1 Tax=Halobacillus karajensis TaxID=195088 RepID=A0A024P7E2_9BACI|nr:hypothetical protein BN982_02603 [Halobacillus karajensis]CDQ25059.1 hypothetical protein BN983_03364 [Halobacillus karajensis]CDQ28580.1 hypothetical protein BN981_02888 [Halobacillus karajensis]SEI11947.1 hypothetical protein SAMN05192559_11430 [Halobacillus karajensis]
MESVPLRTYQKSFIQMFLAFPYWNKKRVPFFLRLAAAYCHLSRESMGKKHAIILLFCLHKG